MPTFKVVLSDPKSGCAKTIEVSGPKANAFLGKKIGDVIDGSVLDLPDGVKIKITGGSGIEGAPMVPFIEGPVKKYVLLSGPPGFHPRKKGERRRKLVRGNTINEQIVQINAVIVYPENANIGPIITKEGGCGKFKKSKKGGEKKEGESK